MICAIGTIPENYQICILKLKLLSYKNLYCNVRQLEREMPFSSVKMGCYTPPLEMDQERQLYVTLTYTFLILEK